MKTSLGKNEKGFEEYRNEKDGSILILIPAGEFIMGSKEPEDAKPQRKVYLDAYYIDKYPVTVKQYRMFCEEAGRRIPSAPSWGWNDDHPIVNVSWNDAVEYCKWAGKRLPTEAEWEKAASGTVGQIANLSYRKFQWGDRNSASPGKASATGTVGSYPSGASPYGCHDIAGNVWEWCSDGYAAYKTEDSRNPTGDENLPERVLRGGSWWYILENHFRCALRYGHIPDGWHDNAGFRCAQDLNS